MGRTPSAALAHWLHIGQGQGMQSLRIRGGRPLRGRVIIGGSKNAALPIIAAGLLTAEPLRLSHVPKLSDVSSMLRLLQHLGSELDADENTLSLATSRLHTVDAPYDLVRKMRTSVLVLGPLLSRFGEARVSLPGGCAIGARPIDLHIKGLQQLGAEIVLEQGYVKAIARHGRLKGATIHLDFASVGATQNLMMAAVLAEGRTTILQPAREPEIAQLAECLNAMGANIRGAGGEKIDIDGVKKLHGAQYRIESDRIQAGSYAMMIAATGGEAFLEGMKMEHLGSALDVLRQVGVIMEQQVDGVQVSVKETIRPVNVVTAPFPGFATDLQAQLMVLLCLADGQSAICEKIFENRFMHVPELVRMGANIHLDGDCALINTLARQERPQLSGADVMATDLRASFCLIMLGLVIEGQTIVHRLYHLDRGYENLTENLQALGADVERGDAETL